LRIFPPRVECDLVATHEQSPTNSLRRSAPKSLWMSWQIDDACESRLEHLLDERRNYRRDSHQKERRQKARG